MERTIFWGKHLAAFVITVLIFSVGLMIGLQVSSSRVKFVEQMGREQRADLESLQLQSQFLQYSKEKNQTCVALQKTLDRSVVRLEDARIRLENYIQNIQLPEYIETKRDYLLNQIRYWLLSQEAQERCGLDVVTVLYFYRPEDRCDDCSSQGLILTSLKDSLKDNLLVFSFDVDFDEEMIRLLAGFYGITKSPSLVINGKRNDGFVEREALLELVCGEYRDRYAVEACVEEKGKI